MSVATTRRDAEDTGRAFIENSFELIAMVDDLDVAKGTLLRLMRIEKRGVVVTRNPALVSNSQWDKFNKWARSVFYCTRIDGGFVVHARNGKLHE